MADTEAICEAARRPTKYLLAVFPEKASAPVGPVAFSRRSTDPGQDRLNALIGVSALWQLMPFFRAWRLGEADAEANRRAAAAP